MSIMFILILDKEQKYTTDDGGVFLLPRFSASLSCERPAINIRPPSGRFFICGHSPLFLAGRVKRVSTIANCARTVTCCP